MPIEEPPQAVDAGPGVALVEEARLDLGQGQVRLRRH